MMRKSLFWFAALGFVFLSVPTLAQEKKPKIRFGLQVAQQQTTIEEPQRCVARGRGPWL